MQKHARFKLIFVALSAGVFALACIATAQLMIQLIGWYLGNCGVATSQCSVADWFISYWWLFFVPMTLLSALLAHRLYVKLSAQNHP